MTTTVLPARSSRRHRAVPLVLVVAAAYAALQWLGGRVVADGDRK